MFVLRLLGKRCFCQTKRRYPPLANYYFYGTLIFAQASNISLTIRSHQNFLPILNNERAFQFTIDFLAQRYATKNISAVIGLESRGFILAAALAYKLGVRFVPIRKPGKLPGALYSVSYKTEYSTDTLVLAQDSLKNGQRVIIIDDLIATGGSARAAIELVRLSGAQPIEFVTLLKVAALEEQARLSIPQFNLID